jgi:hypothetical protein
MDASLTMLAQTRNYLMQTTVWFLMECRLKLRCLHGAVSLLDAACTCAATKDEAEICFAYNDGSLNLPRNV